MLSIGPLAPGQHSTKREDKLEVRTVPRNPLPQPTPGIGDAPCMRRARASCVHSLNAIVKWRYLRRAQSCRHHMTLTFEVAA